MGIHAPFHPAFSGEELNKTDIGSGQMGKGTKSGSPGGNRTHDPLLRRQLLYPLSYRTLVVCII